MFSGVGGEGANGGTTTATISVQPGETLAVFVGGTGGSPASSNTPSTGGFNGGGVGGSRERREALLAEYDRGGMSAKGFAEWAGIKYTTFAWWLQERRRGREQSGTNRPRV
jgi:hypothetical protein